MSGRETPGHVMSDKSGNLYSAITGEPGAPPGTASDAAPESKPELSDRSDNFPASGSSTPAEPVAAADALAGLDEDQVATCRAMLKHFAPEEVQRLQGLSDAELAAIQAPPVPKLSVARELEKIAALRRSDPRAYWADHKLQARELALLEQKTQSAGEATDEPGDGSGLPPETLASWRESGGVEFNLRNAQETASVTFAALAEDGRVELVEAFETLPASVQATVYTSLGATPGFTRSASAEAVSEFAALGEECSALTTSWGATAPQHLGRARARMDSIMRGLSASDRQAAADWLDNLPPAQAAAVIRGLAGKVR